MKLPLYFVPGKHAVIFEADGMGLCTIQGTDQEKKAAEIVQAINAYPKLIAASKAERVYWQHFPDCIVCKPGYECREAYRLWSDARRKRTVAIASVEDQ